MGCYVFRAISASVPLNVTHGTDFFSLNKDEGYQSMKLYKQVLLIYVEDFTHFHFKWKPLYSLVKWRILIIVFSTKKNSYGCRVTQHFSNAKQELTAKHRHGLGIKSNTVKENRRG